MTVPVFDRAHFARVTAGDAVLQAEIKGLFREQAAAWDAALAGPLDAGALRDLAHTIKGSAMGIGLSALAGAGDAVETAAKGGAELAPLAAQLRVVLGAAVHAMDDSAA